MSVAVGDFNGDGVLDLAVTNYLAESVSVLLGPGDGSFAPEHHFGAGQNPSCVAVGDFNGDGILAVAEYSSQSVSVLLGLGDGSFAPELRFGVGPPHSVAVGDFNGDLMLDVAVTNIVDKRLIIQS